MFSRKIERAGKLFGNLKVRPKLMVLHNLFFLVLTTTAYFTLIPLYEQLVTDTGVHQNVLEHPGASAQVARQSQRSALTQAKVRLFLVLGILYMLAVILLESVIMPRYVYDPLRRMLKADSATQAGDREGELIPESEILGDEIGQIMRSRNDTVEALRKREDELAAALRRIEEQDRLVSLGLLSASVAHELNTPLAVLAGSIEKLIETNQDSHTQERLARMQRVTQRLRRISESLVDFSRVRKTQMEATALRPLIEEAWALVAIDEKSSHVDFVNHANAEHRVIGNPDRLLQVFVNLLRNALNAIGGGGPGRIEVRTKREQRDGRAAIVLTVEDNGQGIPAYVLPDIFDAFVTTRLDAHGTGLGLTVAEGIITQHGGTIAASNRPQGGACLEVCLPAAAG
ncbi:MAG TPA: ATP-binding protein [Bryobacteraceae bacterium]|nr:ATP-binding protein [Bryobacteraceae bacterium]